MPHAIAWRGHNPHQALPEHLVQSYPSLNAHTVGYGPFWENGLPEHLLWNARVAAMRESSSPTRWSAAWSPGQCGLQYIARGSKTGPAPYMPYEFKLAELRYLRITADTHAMHSPYSCDPDTILLQRFTGIKIALVICATAPIFMRSEMQVCGIQLVWPDYRG